MNYIVGITGATGVIYGIRLLEALRQAGVQTSLVLSDWAKKTIALETDYTPEQVCALATGHYSSHNLAAAISSGSHRVDGMVIAPCTMKTLSGIAHAYSDNLVIRAADVMLKEQKKLVLLVRETPLNLIHLNNMQAAALAGAIIMPPLPSFYNKPQTVDDIINHTVGRVLDLIGVADNPFAKRWEG